jgi:alpha-tubulin suppressor-like RCC1 family protein
VEDGGHPPSSTIVDVPQLSGITSVVAGGFHSCALAGSDVVCWGANDRGQLGTGGPATDQPSPAKVAVVGASFQMVTAGNAHTCALTGSPGSAGDVVCWGANDLGQLGDGTKTDRPKPTAVSGLTPGATIAVAAGLDHTCALSVDGTVACWGTNYSGQLGDGTNTLRTTPVAVQSLTTATSIALGNGHTCALLAGGGVACWGLNLSGQIGTGSSAAQFSTPQAVSNLPAVTAVTVGGDHTCALAATGAVFCWGANAFLGDLGDGTTTDRASPVPLVGLTATAVSAGAGTTCAISAADGAGRRPARSSAGATAWPTIWATAPTFSRPARCRSPASRAASPRSAAPWAIIAARPPRRGASAAGATISTASWAPARARRS